MAGPGKPGRPRKGGEIELAEHHARVINLRSMGRSYPSIATETGYDVGRVWRIVRDHLAEVGPSREDAEKIRAMLFAEHEAVKEQLVPYVFPEDDDGNPKRPDPAALAHHLARGKEQADLYHLHGKQDDLTHDEGEVNASATAKAQRMEILMHLLQEKGLAGQPVLDEVPEGEASPHNEAP